MSTAHPSPDLAPVCELCGAPLEAAAERCGECGMYRADAGTPPGSRLGLALLLALLGACYLLALVVVALAR